MPSIVKRMPSRAGVTGMDVAVVDQPQNRNKTGIKVTVAIFFDGTLNNRINTNARLGSQQAGQTKKWTGSYSGWHSNVSLLEHFNRKREPGRREASIYVEGIGTVDMKGDDTLGKGLGTGFTGILAKVQRGVNLIREYIAWIVANEEEVFVEEVEFDVFGFSRGAAAARNFISRHTYAPAKLAADIGTPQAKMTFKFVGLFDTVASHGVVHTNDVKDLNLRIGAGKAKKVVQLQAGDEYRTNFSLTNVASTVGDGGYQLTMPGVHSDVGGGYEVEGEVRELLSETEAWYLQQEGWYRREEIFETQEYLPSYGGYGGYGYASMPVAITKYTGKRASVGNTYQYIPLDVMRSCAVENNMMSMHSVEEELYSSFRPAEELAPLHRLITAAVNQHGRAGDNTITLSGLGLGPTDVFMVRNLHLHRSADETSFGMGGRYKNGYLPDRRTFEG
jgi:hypothetical protein